MRFPPQFRMSVTRRGEKEQRLAAFIAHSLARAARGGPPGISVIARSVQSPVVRALGALAAELAGAGASLRLLVTRPDGFSQAGGGACPLRAALNCELRLAKDPRLIEAHEQLVLGPRTCWTGDSMRRDPAACDAYESFVDDCAEIASAAQSTFERLWSGAEPLLGRAPPASLAAAAGGLERRP